MTADSRKVDRIRGWSCFFTEKHTFKAWEFSSRLDQTSLYKSSREAHYASSTRNPVTSSQRQITHSTRAAELQRAGHICFLELYETTSQEFMGVREKPEKIYRYEAGLNGEDMLQQVDSFSFYRRLGILLDVCLCVQVFLASCIIMVPACPFVRSFFMWNLHLLN